jgi:ectoine hydroxylase-related dioxygenase (phytanoyl-CoA dioxygenase family)
MHGTFRVEEFKNNGFTVLREYVDKSVLAEIVQEYDRTYALDDEGEIQGDVPTVVLWTHVVGSRKKLRPLTEMPALQRFATEGGLPNLIKELSGGTEIRLLEIVVFNKPPGQSNVLRWHQDVAYFPLEPNNQFAVWLPFDVVTRDVGAMIYAAGSHQAGLRGSVNLHTGEKFDQEDRPLIPDDPEAAGYPTVCVECQPGDMITHSGLCWHMSTPNVTKDRPRRGLTLRYLVGETYFRPRPGSAATFMGQMDLRPGQRIDGPAFPVVA